MKNLINQRLPRNLESVTSYRGDSRVIEGWMGRQQRLATVREQKLWRCKVCDEYFQTLAEAKEHRHG
jgi:hypothetical protein